MKTIRLECAQEAGRLLNEGKLVAFPTETVFGLGADATNDQAVLNLFAAKGRPADNPLIVHLADVHDWPQAAREMPETAIALLAHFAPGPLTVVVPKHPRISRWATAQLDSVGLRIPSCQQARQLITSAGKPVAAPSANRSGRPSCTTWRSTLEDLEGRVDAVLCHDAVDIGLESTVVDCRNAQPVLLRPGAISLSQLQGVVAEVIAVQRGLPTGSPAVSPGTKHPHYQPRAKVLLWDRRPESALPAEAEPRRTAICGIDLSDPMDDFMWSQSFTDWNDYSRGFYEFLREADRRGVDWIVCQLAGRVGIQTALRDRQFRAAGA